MIQYYNIKYNIPLVCGTGSNGSGNPFSEVGESFPASGGGSPVPTSKASSGGGPSLRRSVHKLPVLSEEKEWFSSASYHFETAKWVRAEAALQDGRLGMVKDLLQSDTGCVPWTSRMRTTQYPLPRNTVDISFSFGMAGFYEFICLPQNFHEVVMSSNGSLAFTGCKTDKFIDILLIHQSKELLVQQVKMTVQLMELLVFTKIYRSLN